MSINHETPIPIVADDRERGSGVIQHLQSRPQCDVSVRRLPLGDYEVDDRFLFERKTLVDLALSIKSGRLFDQALRLAGVEGLRPAMVLEGTLQDMRGCGMRWEAIQGALITVTLFLGLPVLRTRSPEETARTFLYAVRQQRATAAGALPRRGYRPKGKAALQRYILQGLPGVGPERARRLIRHFGSVEAALSADVDGLMAVPGIGEETARKMAWAVKEQGGGYDAGLMSMG